MSSGVRPVIVPSRNQGFILVTVLVALVVITMVAAAVAVVSERAVRESEAELAAFAAELSGIGTRDTVLYLLTTQRQTFGGLTIDDRMVWSSGQATAAPGNGDFEDSVSLLPVGNEIVLDGTPYRGLGGTAFALQDDAGLFSVNWTVPPFRDRFLEVLGVGAAERDALEALRLDYQDDDSLTRVAGAEADAYRDAELPPPSNMPLATPLELRRVMGWRKALEDVDDVRIASLMTTSRSVMLNVNTAPAEVLQSIPGVDAATADRMISLRNLAPFMLDWEFRDTFPLPIDETTPIGMLAVGYGTLTLWHNAGGAVRQIHWTLTPIDEGGRPWRLDYEITLPRDHVPDATLVRPTGSPLFAAPPAAGR